MPGYVIVQTVPTAEQFEAIFNAVMRAGFQDVIATYGQTPHPVSGTGLTIVLNHLDPERIARARKCWVDELSSQGFETTLA